MGIFLLGATAVAGAAESRPGQAVAGLQASISVDRLQGSIGDEGPKMTFTLTNASTQPIRIFNRLDVRWPGTNSLATISVAISRPDGTAYAPPERISNLTAGPRPEEFTWLGPGDSVSTGPIPLLDPRGIRDAGWFRITAFYRNQFTKLVAQDGTVHEEPEVWIGTVVSNAVTIDVRA